MIGNDNRFVSAFGRIGETTGTDELAHVVARAVEAGFAIVLCEPGGKKPVCTHVSPTARARADRAAQKVAKEAGNPRWDRVRHECGLKHALDGDPAKARTTFRKVQMAYGQDNPLNIAIVPGRSRMMVIDIDTPEQFGDLDLPLTVSSPGGGGHHDGGHIWLDADGIVLPDGNKYTSPEGWTAMWGENYVLVPPSKRPEGSYRFESPDVLKVPDWLLDVISQASRPKEGPSGPKAPGDSIDGWAAETPWAELLTQDPEWEPTGRVDQCGCPIWHLAGRQDQKSATAHEPPCRATDTSTGHGPLHLWTDAGPDYLGERRTLTKLQFVAAKDFDGNTSLAMKSLGLKAQLSVVPDGDPFADPDEPAEPDRPDQPFTRIVDLGPYLDGDLSPEVPTVGALSSNDRPMLYAGKWHTVVGLTTAGKSWFALWHAQAVLEAGGTVVYAHFEEGSPRSTLARLIQLGVDKQVIRDRFIWLSDEQIWSFTDMAKVVKTLQRQHKTPSLVVLDGMIAGASRQGWKVNDPESVKAYLVTFVDAATRAGAAVLSLGHPVKDRTRQDEIHSFGSSAWLDQTNGVGFRMVASDTPIRRGHTGSSWVSVVKDREGGVIEQTEIESGKSEPWYSLGRFVVDDARLDMDGPHLTHIRMEAPRPSDEDREIDRTEQLARAILDFLVRKGGVWVGRTKLYQAMSVADPKVGGKTAERGLALAWLAERGLIRIVVGANRNQPETFEVVTGGAGDE